MEEEVIDPAYVEKFEAVSDKFMTRFCTVRDQLLASEDITAVDRLKIYTSCMMQVLLDSQRYVGTENTLTLLEVLKENFKGHVRN